MNRKLRRFSHRADEEEQGHGCSSADLESRPERQSNRHLSGPCEELLELERAVQLIGERDPGEKRRVGDAQERKGLERSRQGPSMGMVVREHVEQIAEDLPE